MAKQISWKNILITIIIVAIIYSFWNTWMIFPFKIFTVYMHEVSHGVAAIATGGEFGKMEINMNEGGHALTRGGNLFLILNAGYLGSLIIGCIILYLSKFRKINWLLILILDVAFIAITLFYVRNLFGVIASVIFIAALTAMIFAPKWLKFYFLRITALTSCCYVFYDIVGDVFTGGSAIGDATRAAKMILMPTYVVGALWLIIAAIMVALTLKLSMVEKKKGKLEDWDKNNSY